MSLKFFKYGSVSVCPRTEALSITPPSRHADQKMTSKRMADTRLRMAQTMTPNDANVLGKVFGGSILALIDLAASATASRFAGHICVTASFDRVDFHEPVEIGEFVELDGRVTYVGRTSVEVTIDVYATVLTSGVRRHVNTARVTMVAVENGRPVEVPRLICETREEKIDFLSGKLRREVREQRVVQLKELIERLSNLPDDDLEKLMGQNLAVLPQLIPSR